MTQPRGTGPDPIGDFQRWLVRSGARSMTRELGGHVAGAFGLGGKPADVWGSATAPPPHEAPECAWCPVCRAARLLRDSGPGLASHMSSASETLASLVAEAASVVESALAAAGRRPGAPPAGPAAAWEPATAAPETPPATDSASVWEEAAAESQDAPATAVPVPADPVAGDPAEQAAATWAEATGNGTGPLRPATGNGKTGNGKTGNGPAGGPRSGGPAE